VTEFENSVYECQTGCLTRLPVWDPLENDDLFSEGDLFEGDVNFFEQVFSEVVKTDREHTYIKDNPLYGMEVGDDRVDITRHRQTLELEMHFQESVLKMVSSKEDTFISKEVWNFCEVSNPIPASKLGSFDAARKSGSFKNLEYTDCPALRLVIDVSKGDRSHSSTVTGKSSMLASRVNAPREQHKDSLQLFSLFQDAMLRTARAPDPKYLPVIMGGCGATPLFGEASNTLLYVKAFHGGTMSRLYGTATQEAKYCLRQMDKGQHSSTVLCQRLRDRQEYLHGTYAAKVLIPPERGKILLGRELPEPLYRATGGINLFQGVENRLIRTKHIMTRREAEIAMEQSSRTIDIIKGLQTLSNINLMKKAETFYARQRYDGALQANTAFSRLINRTANGSEPDILVKEGFLMIGCGVTDYTFDDANWLLHGAKSEYFSISDLGQSHDIFVRDEVSTEQEFRVGGIPLRPVQGANRVLETSRRVGLYEISKSMEEWSENLMARLLSSSEKFGRPLPREILTQEFNQDREWVNDDSGIIAQALLDTQYLDQRYHVLLISADKRLGNQLSRTCNVIVLRLDPSHFITAMEIESWNSSRYISYEEISPHLPFINHKLKGVSSGKVYYDHGSISAAASKLEVAPLKSGKVREIKYFSRELVSVRRHPHRGETYIRREIERKQVIPAQVHTPVLKQSMPAPYGLGMDFPSKD